LILNQTREAKMRAILLVISLMAVTSAAAEAQYLGNYTANPYVGSPAMPQSPGTFSNPYGNNFNSPKMYDSQGSYHGNLNANPYDPNSVANPYGRYGSPYSSDSVNNPYGAGSPYRQDSPTNPYGHGMGVYR
jgi:hypothetical protein